MGDQPPNETLTPVLAALVRREDLEPDTVRASFAEILEGRVSDIQAAGFATALRTKGETPEELAALVATMLDHGLSIDVGDGAIDTCGTGGDRSGTVNVSTMAALIAAGAGVKVVKHGNRAASSQCGSADVLEALGVAIELDPQGVETCVAEAGIGFCFARTFHPALRFMGPARAALAVPTTFNYLGPLANPARVRRQALGVSDPAMAHKMVAVLAELGAERALVFHGDDGLDELTTTTTSQVHELTPDGGVHTFEVDPQALGLAKVELDALRGSDAASNADAVRSVLAGETGPLRDIALLNAAAALMVADRAAGIAQGIEIAAESVDRGDAQTALDNLVRVSTDMAGKS